MNIKHLYAVVLLSLIVRLSNAQEIDSKVIFELSQSEVSVVSELKSIGDNKGGVFWIFRSHQPQENSFQIQARHSSQSGKEYWTSPVLISLSKFNKKNIQVVHSQTNGFIVVWEEYRKETLEADVFCQKMDASGQRLWGDEGICVVQDTSNQKLASIIPDNMGGIYISWINEIDNNEEKDIGIQYVDLNGRIRWDQKGVVVTQAKGTQTRPVLSLEPGKSVICIWEDYRNQRQWQLFGQKVNNNGVLEWEKDGLLLLPERPFNQKKPTVVGDGYGGFMCVYEASGLHTDATDLHFVRISRIGTVVFETVVCNFSDNQLNPILFKFGSYVYLFWEDFRKGNADLYWQKMDLYTGKPVWSTEGQALCTSPGEQKKALVSEGSSGSLWVVWHDFRLNNSQIFAQQVNTDGKIFGEPNGFKVGSIPEDADITITPDNQGGIWVGTLNGEITQLRVTEERTIQTTLTNAHQRVIKAQIAQLSVISGQENDYYVAWQDFRVGEKNPDIYLQRIDFQGKPLWKEPLAVCTAPGEQSRPVMFAKQGAVFIVWVDRRTGKDENLYLQKVDSAGIAIWTKNGVPVCVALRSQNSPKLAATNRGMIVLWNDARNFDTHGFDIYGQYFDFMGNTLWAENGIPIAAGPGYQTTPKIKQVDDQKITICWMDDRSNFYNIYAARVSLQGSLIWVKPIAPASYHQRNPSIDSDPTGIVIAWSEDRFGNKFEKVCTQKITWSGELLWGEHGQLVCDAYGKQTFPKISIDKSYGAVVVWIDSRNPAAENTLMLQRLNLMGKPTYLSAGVKLGEKTQESPQVEFIIHDNTIFLTWIQQQYTGNYLTHYQQIDIWAGEPTLHDTRLSSDALLSHQEVQIQPTPRSCILFWIAQVSPTQTKIVAKVK